MPVNLVAPDPAGLHAVAGLELGTARAGIRKPDRRDLLVVRIAAGVTTAGVFTRNRFCAAPVTLCREHLAASQARRGRSWSTPAAPTPAPEPSDWNAGPSAPRSRRLLGQSDEVMPMSTGVILEHLPVDHGSSGSSARRSRIPTTGQPPQKR